MNTITWISVFSILTPIHLTKTNAAVMITSFERTHSADITKNSRNHASFSITSDNSPFTDESRTASHGGSSAEYNLDFTTSTGTTDALTPVGSNSGFTLNWISQSTLIEGNNTDTANINSSFSFQLQVTGEPATLIMQKMAIAGSNYNGATLSIYDSTGTNLLYQATGSPSTNTLQAGSYIVKFDNSMALNSNGYSNSAYDFTLQVLISNTTNGPLQVPEAQSFVFLGIGATTILLIRRRNRIS